MEIGMIFSRSHGMLEYPIFH